MFPEVDDSRGLFGDGPRYDHESEEEHILEQSSIFASMAMPERSVSPNNSASPITCPRSPHTGSDTSYELAVAAALEGEWGMETTVYEMEPSRGSPPRQAVDYSGSVSSITPNPTQLPHAYTRDASIAVPAPVATSNCSSCGIALVQGNTFSGGKLEAVRELCWHHYGFCKRQRKRHSHRLDRSHWRI